MTPERWAQIEELFYRTADCSQEERDQLLSEACNGDSDLRREVEVLLGNDDGAGDRMQAAIEGGLDAMTFPLIGTTVSHYRILDGLGGGGMGLVYRAEDLKLGRQVALKFLPEESAEDPSALARFEREARTASALEHPNICPIYEFGEHEGRPFLVMQLLQGRTLRELLSGTAHAKSSMEISTVLDLALQVAEGLQAAHQHGIIHRDIKPANIFVTVQGQAKILDFGLAKLAGGVSDEEVDNGASQLAPGKQTAHGLSLLTPPDPLLSRTGVAMGTAGYMSPEQARGEKLDARTDIFSFGLVLYEMATGQRAFQGDTGPVLREAILRRNPSSARNLNRRLPQKLDLVLRKALQKERLNRYQSAEELRGDLLTLRRSLRTRQLVWRLLPVALTALVLIAGTYWYGRHKGLPIQPLPEIKFRQLTVNSSENPVQSGSISPDGNYLAYVDQQGMHIKDLETGATHAVSSPDNLPRESVHWEILDAAWLLDNSAFIANAHPASEPPNIWSSLTSTIWSFSREGAPPKKLRDNAWAFEVLADGSISFGTNREHESWLMGPDQGEAHRVLESDSNSQVIGPVAQSSVNKQIVLYARHDSSGDFLLSRNLRGGQVTTLFTPAQMNQIPGDFAWLPDGRLIYQAVDNSQKYQSIEKTCNFWSLPLDLHTGRPVGPPQRMTNWTGFCSGEINATADGKRVAVLQHSDHGTGYIAELADGGMRIVNSRHFTLDDADDAITDWTPDGEQVILTSHRADGYGLYKQQLVSDTPQLLASFPHGGSAQANVSADGKWILAQTWLAPDRNQIVRVPIGGDTPMLITTVPPGLGSFDCARPPSARCLLGEISGDHKQMVVSEFDPFKGKGDELARFDFDPEFDPTVNSKNWSLSPDGTRFAIGRGPAGPIQIYSFKDHSTRLIRPKGHVYMANPAWSADGKALYFSNRTNEGMEILHMDLQGNTTSLWKNNGRTFCVPSPDGRHVAIYDVRKSANMWVMENF